MLYVISSCTSTALLAGAGVLTALQAMSAALLVLLIARAFPRSIRTSGLATAFGLVATLFGGTAQLVFTWLIKASDDLMSPLWYVSAMNIASVLATLAISSRCGTAAATRPISIGMPIEAARPHA